MSTGEFLSRDDCKALFDRITGLITGGGEVSLSLVSQWRSTSTWARNRIYVSSDAHQVDLYISRSIHGASGSAVTTRVDDDSLRHAIRNAEKSAYYGAESFEWHPRRPSKEATLEPRLWSDATMALTADARADVARQMVAAPETAGYISAGEIVVGAQGRAVLNTSGTFRYYPVTMVEVSTSIRDGKHGASGWAGVTDFEWGRVDPLALGARAFEKAKRSANPVAIEPGRYTSVLEPQAVADLFSFVVEQTLDRRMAESGRGPFAAGNGNSKISERVLDARLRLRADPMDPLGAFVPFEGWSGEAYRPVNWIDQGVLRDLSYDRSYALAVLGTDQALPNSESYRLEIASGAPTSTIDDMIANTQRGLLVTRFSDVRMVDLDTVMLSGFTRDGVWLIEHGKIVKAVKNFRFTESPMFILNNLEQIGTPTRVFNRRNAVVVPPIKVRDFSMTALSDAV